MKPCARAQSEIVYEKLTLDRAAFMAYLGRLEHEYRQSIPAGVSAFDERRRLYAEQMHGALMAVQRIQRHVKRTRR